jgi:hypothetical protein
MKRAAIITYLSIIPHQLKPNAYLRTIILLFLSNQTLRNDLKFHKWFMVVIFGKNDKILN